MKDRCVYPKGLSKVLQEYGLCAKYYSGNLKALQNEVCKGTPVIVMIVSETIKIGCIMFLSLDLMTDMCLLQNRYQN